MPQPAASSETSQHKESRRSTPPTLVDSTHMVKSVVEHDIVTKQNAVAASLIDAPHILHTWVGTAPPLGILLRGGDIRISPYLKPPISPGLRPRTSRTTMPQTVLN